MLFAIATVYGCKKTASPKDEEVKVEETKPIYEQIKEAQSCEEASRLIDGTTWHYTENLSTSNIGGWVKVSFKNGHYTTYHARPADGKWTKGGEGIYHITEGRYSNTGEKYISVSWEGDMSIEFLTVPCQFTLTLDNFQLHVGSNLIDGMSTLNDRFAGRSYQYSAMRKKMDLVGTMEFGDYSWDYSDTTEYEDDSWDYSNTTEYEDDSWDFGDTIVI